MAACEYEIAKILVVSVTAHASSIPNMYTKINTIRLTQNTLKKYNCLFLNRIPYTHSCADLEEVGGQEPAWKNQISPIYIVKLLKNALDPLPQQTKISIAPPPSPEKN